jgi:hypothetical protein
MTDSKSKSLETTLAAKLSRSARRLPRLVLELRASAAGRLWREKVSLTIRFFAPKDSAAYTNGGKVCHTGKCLQKHDFRSQISIITYSDLIAGHDECVAKLV